MFLVVVREPASLFQKGIVEGILGPREAGREVKPPRSQRLNAIQPQPRKPLEDALVARSILTGSPPLAKPRGKLLRFGVWRYIRVRS